MSIKFLTKGGVSCRIEGSTLTADGPLESGVVEGRIPGAEAGDDTRIKVWGVQPLSQEIDPDTLKVDYSYRCIKPERWEKPYVLYDAILGGEGATPIVVGSIDELDALLAVELFGFGWVRRVQPCDNTARCLFPAKSFKQAQAGKLANVFPYMEPATGNEGLMLRWNRYVPHFTGDDWAGLRLVIQEREAAGYHWRLATPFTEGDDHSAGLTPKGESGWNGMPDFYRKAPTLGVAAGLTALASLGLDVRYEPLPGDLDEPE